MDAIIHAMVGGNVGAANEPVEYSIDYGEGKVYKGQLDPNEVAFGVEFTLGWILSCMAGRGIDLDDDKLIDLVNKARNWGAQAELFSKFEKLLYEALFDVKATTDLDAETTHSDYKAPITYVYGSEVKDVILGETLNMKSMGLHNKWRDILDNRPGLVKFICDYVARGWGDYVNENFDCDFVCQIEEACELAQERDLLSKEELEQLKDILS